MPLKNTIKKYVTHGVYHLYNRGIEKRLIFMDDQDYGAFLNFLKDALTGQDEREKKSRRVVVGDKSFMASARQPKNFKAEIDLLAFCLMPNHFHLMVKQTSERAIKAFMQSLITRYSIYFNRKYHRIGGLFQGRYKAVLLPDDNSYLYLTRYIHRNPIVAHIPYMFTYSSYNDYLGISNNPWLNSNFVLSLLAPETIPGLGPGNTYRDFVESEILSTPDGFSELLLENPLEE